MVKIIGSCGIESRENYFKLYQLLLPILGNNFLYKASFDKANRSSMVGSRGVGLEKALGIFFDFKQTYPQAKITTDIHETYQAEYLKGVVDCIQIPAMLCRQTDLIVAAAKVAKIVNIKKGQWMSPQNMVKSLDKIKDTNPNCQAWVTERGTQFGYGQLIVDFGAVDFLKEHFDKVILDCTHSTQRLKPNGFTGGCPKLGKKYIRAASIFEYDGIFAEVHFNPEESVSDKDSILNLQEFEECLNLI